jgi:diaminopimelate epimerase
MAELKVPTAEVPRPLALELRAGETRVFQGRVGVPHTIFTVDDIATVDVVGRGRALRYASEFAPAGTNVNFVGPTAQEDASWALRTYERGVEDETLACGTGTIAAALALAGAGLAQLPLRIRSSSGCVYSVSATIDGGLASDVWLCGEGRLVFVGELTA